MNNIYQHMNEKLFFHFIMFIVLCVHVPIQKLVYSLTTYHICIHKYQSSNLFICKQNGCYREFHKLNKFKEHLLNKHVISQNIITFPQSRYDFEVQSIDTVEKTYILKM